MHDISEVARIHSGAPLAPPRHPFARRSAACLLLVLSGLGPGVPLRAAQPESASKRVLLIHSDSVRLPVGEIQDSVIREALGRFDDSVEILGTGTVGGVVFAAWADTEAAAGLVVEILEGVKPETLRPLVSPAAHMFDWRALRRYGLSESELPSGSTLLFREPTVWDRYQRPILLLAAFVVLETCLVVFLVMQVKARRKSENALQHSVEHVQDLAGRLIAAQEDERRRLAMDLHDGMSQELALLSIEVDQLQRQALPGSPAARHPSMAVSLVDSIASTVRDISHQLHPAKLEMVGLPRAVEALCRDVSKKHEVHVDFRAAPMPAAIAPEVALCLYRVTQEALHNVAKHSGARRAAVSLVWEDADLVLAISDSGMGFDAGATLSKGLGLVSMRERVHFLKGQFAIHSEPGLGTRLAVRVPIRPAGADATPVRDSPRMSASA